MTDEQQIFCFTNGIPGFEKKREFIFVSISPDMSMQLMKTVDEEVTLLVVNPFLFYPEYEWELPESSRLELQIESEHDVEIWSVVTVPEDPHYSTLNLLAPIVLNVNKRLGKQLILHDQPYSSRTPLNREVGGNGHAGAVQAK